MSVGGAGAPSGIVGEQATIREQLHRAYCYHYMYDILIATSTKDGIVQIQPKLIQTLQEFGLQIAPEKVQQQVP